MTVQKNQDIELKIDGITTQGWGVGHYNGLAVFVANTAIGDTIIAHIIKAKKNYAIAKLLKIITPAADRYEPDCSVFSQCGGCSFRHITYDSELKIKYKRVEDSFLRIGHIDITPQPVIGCEMIDGYRNKAQYPVSFDGELKIGFYAPNSHRIVGCKDCKLQPDEFTTALNIFEDFIKQYNISVYNEKENSGLLRHIYLRKAISTSEILACAVINGKSLPNADKLAELLKNNIPMLKGFVININQQDTNVILGEKCKTIWGQDYITDILCGCKFKISTLSFYQVNSVQAEKLYEKAREYAHLSKDDVLLDLYCGTGTIGITMASDVKKLIGVEIIEQAVEDAKVNAKLNGIENATFICGDASDATKELEKTGEKPDVVLVDPPRKGLSKEVVEAVANMQPKRIVYISCDPATLARDCEIFEGLSYKVQEVTPVDMFPRTAHVETVVLLSKGEIDSKKIKVEFSLEDMDMSGFQKGATYGEIKDYVLKQTGLKVSSLYVSQIKRKCGLDVGQNYNLSKKENARAPQCPPEKEKAIMEALKYFGMIG